MAKEQLTKEQLKDLSTRINSLFASVNVDDVSADSVGFSNVPEGYFLCEVKKAEVTVSKSGNPQVAVMFKIVEDGRKIEDTTAVVESSKNEILFKYYPLVNNKDAKKFVSDMLKFEVDEEHNTLPKEAFINDETINDALDVINGLQIYVQHTVTTNTDGSKSTWDNLITWKRAGELDLPC